MKKILSLVLIFGAIQVFGQKMEFGKVSEDELKETQHPKDTSAAAAYLFKSGRYYFEVNGEGAWIFVQEIKKKIKIYKKEGYEYATEEVPYYTGGKQVRLYFDDAATYNLVNGKVEKTKLKSDGEFKEVVNGNYSIKKIALPNVKEGSIIEYSYTLKTPYFVALPEFRFQHYIPVNSVQLQVNIPQYFIYSRFLRGYADVKAGTETVVQEPSKRFNESKVIYTAENVKALKDENYVNNLDNYTSIINYELASYTSPGGMTENFSTDWPSVVKTIYEDKDFGNELDYKSYFEKDLAPLIQNVSSRQEKMMVVFNYVKSRMTFNDKFGYYCDKGVKKAYNEKTGNVAEINLMLTAMLRYAELDANPVLVSTRSNGVALFPNRTAYNYVIAAVDLDAETRVLLDATSKNTMPNILPLRALNWIGRLIRPNKTSVEIELMPHFNSKEVVTVLASLDKEGTLNGKMRRQYFDYNAFLFREHFSKMAKESYLEGLEKRLANSEVNEHTTTNEKELAKPMIETFDFTRSASADIIGDKIYFTPMLQFYQNENPFKQEVREFPVEYPFPFNDRYQFTINVPDGYVIESLPKPIVISMENNIGSYTYNISQNNNTIQLSVSFDINLYNIAPDYYPTLKDFYKAMIEKQNEKVVLKRV
ncbi:DUF3857 domain-containing protein [Flavobacterium sp. NST-5]|uniref:DUF3857 domain-containing protein n=1 Tax=Flavobacterium ichthyis TaxID=2698827 RepID=A0ABW9Z4J6_9FLAO|nr:DUF3858 domain-containing protein [Flavobacterium ichthyis]NBL63760.1 DUF3857 domain-containing protein [Flavobacterium ichthyis]